MDNNLNCDIAIIGGGPVGLCAALALQHCGKSVSIIEASPLDQPGEDVEGSEVRDGPAEFCVTVTQ